MLQTYPQGVQMTPPPLLGLVAALATVITVRCNAIHDVSALDKVTFRCEPQEDNPTAGNGRRTWRFWILPTGTMMYPSSQDNDQVKVLQRGRYLLVKNVSAELNQGTFFCLVYRSWQCEFRVASKHQIVPSGDTSFFTDTRAMEDRLQTEEDKILVQAGGLVGSIALALLSSLCVVLMMIIIYNSRRRDRPNSDHTTPPPNTRWSPRCCVNWAFLPDSRKCCRPPAPPAPPPYPPTQINLGKEPSATAVGSGEGAVEV